MNWLSRLFKPSKRSPLPVELWHRVVAIAREREWYADRGVADTVEGRFDMITAVLALVLIRLEREGDVETTARLTELFVDDMDGQLREAGVGDLVVGKRMGHLVAALGGRIGAYRQGLASDDNTALAAAARRNVTLTDESESGEGLAAGLRALMADIDAALLPDLLDGSIMR